MAPRGGPVVVLLPGLGHLDGLLGLAGPASRPLARDHHALEEELASPDAPRLTPFEGSVEAQRLHGAVGAEGLGVLHVRGGLGKPQLCVVDAAGQQLLIHSGSCVVQGSELVRP